MKANKLHIAIRCTHCGSKNINSKGKGERTRNRGRPPRYRCNSCGRSFRYGPFTHDKRDIKTVKKVIELTVDGKTFRDIARKLSISTATVTKIVHKYAMYLGTYMEKCITPLFGRTWELDDMFINLSDNYSVIKLSETTQISGVVENRKLCLTNIIDKRTRFWIAGVLALSNEVAVTIALTKSKDSVISSHRVILLTDANPIYPKILKLFPMFNHVSQSKDENLNIVPFVERLHRTIRDSVLPKNRRRFRSVEVLQDVLVLLRFYYNFIRPHTGRGLDGQTPAEKAGCKLPGEDKWLEAVAIGYQKLLESKWMERKFLEKIHRKRFHKATAKLLEKAESSYPQHSFSNEHDGRLDYYLHEKHPDLPVSDDDGEGT